MRIHLDGVIVESKLVRVLTLVNTPASLGLPAAPVMSPFLSTSQAATRKGCTRQAIVNAIHRAELNAQRVGHNWAVADDEVLAAWTVKETGGRTHGAVRSSKTAEGAA